ncbi:mobile element protein [Geminocystis sp. NIES-3708]|nr:mobile element protein [Geminocystis sp. NIES-3708]
MLNLAGISWKKSQKSNPKEDQELVEKKQEIIDWLEINSYEIQTGELAVFFEDECHLLWGDTCGYIWGKKE